ncbi:hypothetical protein [Novilysobacter arseniciresistens]|uniref:hypothetical protein n=1 Tax=Novilysobacter arseniciresistens TaxID=1385522 RepID=UPI00136232D5|nr:hypothetical protein [Lysobacter arseniciresistens]
MTPVLALVLAIGLAACTDGPAAEAEYTPPAPGAGLDLSAPDGAVEDWPAIHLDQVQERMVDGENAARRDYHLALDRCRETGWPVRELEVAELERLGTTRLRMWISPGLEVIRDDHWTLGLEDGAPVDSCLFQLEYSGRYSHANGSTEMSRELGTAASAGSGVVEPVPGGEILPRFPLDPAADAPAGFTAIGTSQVAGASCRAWRGRGIEGGIEQCLWSGGRAFGFDDRDAGEGCSPTRPVEASLDAIVLSQEPLDGKGCRIRTLAFTVGEALDPDAYADPDGDDA